LALGCILHAWTVRLVVCVGFVPLKIKMKQALAISAAQSAGAPSASLATGLRVQRE
jgi:hypothetical protein